MKLASLDDGSRDGCLAVVSRDLARAVAADGIAATMIEAVERWAECEAALRALAAELEAGPVRGEQPFLPERVLAPLPRARQFLDGSAFLTHGRLMDRAFDMKPNPDLETIPMMYQGMSDDFRGPGGSVEFAEEVHGIDFEGEFGVILGNVPMGTAPDAALSAVRLVVQLNDWSLRGLAVREMKVGFGWVQAKPTCSFAPVAITPDELGPAWRGGRLDLDLHIWRGEEQMGWANGLAMHFSFGDLIAYAARTRRLHAGAVLGSGTVANDDRARGSSCLSEVRALEMIESGAPRTPFLSSGERIRMEARLADGTAPFGRIDQTVAVTDQ